MTVPVVPSIMIVSPERTRSVMSRTPTTAGMLTLRAMIDVCEAQPPTLVTKPSTPRGSKSAVTEGSRSSATMIESFASSLRIRETKSHNSSAL